MLYQFSEAFVQVFSHDEVVHGKGSMLNKMHGDTISAKSVNLGSIWIDVDVAWEEDSVYGSDFGQSNEWNYSKA